MKKLYFLLVVAALCLTSATASAQFLNQGGSRNSSSAEVSSVMNFYDITYSPVNMKYSYDDDSNDEDYKAVSLNWGQARSLTNSLPVYLHYGFGLQYTWKTDKESEEDDYYSYSIKTTTSFLTAVIPVNLMYSFNVPNTAVALMPYVGLNLQGHILGQSKTKSTFDYDGETESETEKTNYFSKDDMGDDPYKRFVIGWQIGAKVSFNKYFVGIAYEGPVSNLYKEGDAKINTNQINISLGIRF